MRLLSTLIPGLIAMACGTSARSVVDDLSFDRRQKNIAVIFGAPNDLTGIDHDLRMMQEVASHERYGFEVRRRYKASKTEIFEMTKAAAAEVGESGTLLWYFSGHGAASGRLMAQPGMVDFDELASVVKQVRSTPLKRFVVMIDSCFSGQMVDGQLAISRHLDSDYSSSTIVQTEIEKRYTSQIAYSNDYSRSSEAQALSHLSDAVNGAVVGSFGGNNSYSSSLAEQLLVISASSRNNTSLAGTDGSTFTKGVYDAFERLKSQQGVKVSDFISHLTENTRRNSGGHHRPRFTAIPETLLNEPLVSSAIPSETSGNEDAVEIDQDIFLLLASRSTSGMPVYVSGSSRLASAVICSGDSKACLENRDTAITLAEVATTGIAERKVFRGAIAALAEGQIYTLIGLDQNERATSARDVRFQRQ